MQRSDYVGCSISVLVRSIVLDWAERPVKDPMGLRCWHAGVELSSDYFRLVFRLSQW